MNETFVRRGFLPEPDPLRSFPRDSELAVLDEWGHDLPSLLIDPGFRKYARELQIPPWPETERREETLPQLRLYYVRLGFLASAYINQVSQPAATLLPGNIAAPLCHACRLLGRPPILSYDGYALYNWKRFDPQGPIALGNIDTLQNFVHLYDEHWFILVHVEIEAIAAEILAAIRRVQHALGDRDQQEEVVRAMAKEHGLDFVDLNEVNIPPDVIELVPASVARENSILPMSEEDGALRVITSDPLDYETQEKLRFILNRDVRIALAPRENIQESINRHYGQTEAESADSMLQEFTDTAIDSTETMEEGAKEEQVQQALEQIAKAVWRQVAVLRRIPEKMDPALYYRTFRPYIRFFENVVYEGVTEAPLNFRGETGAQSSIMPTLVAFMKIPHRQSALTDHLADMRRFMPPEHRGVIEEVQRMPDVRPLADKRAYNDVLEAMATFREVHFGWAQQYINRWVEDPRGTGGTPYMQWLRQMVEETRAHKLP